MPKSGKFGTFAGVYTPSILTILGVIMYMRLGWVVGNAGSLTTIILIILMAHVVSVTTGLSVSSIATDKKIRGGGIYYMLSRSLGFPIGGAIGVTLFVATALSIALYLIGFGESALLAMKDYLGIEEITTNHLRVVGSLALLMIVTIAFISTSIAIKTQFFILGAIVLSLISILFGTTAGKGFDFAEVSIGQENFSTLFGIFFPAVTGFTAGVAMSGDLRDPKKSIPWGTMLAVATGFAVYIGLALFIFYHIPMAELQKNNNALVEFSWVPQLVIAGIWGATLSSALGGILGAPRILQAMSLDGITPKIFAKGIGRDNEPRNALILTFILAEAGILIGELDVIAEVVAMFYLAAYMFINLSAFLEQWASPDFQPAFKINIFIPLVGAIVTLLLMIQLNIAATIASVIIILFIFLWLTRKQLELGTGDVWQNVWSSIVKFGLKNLNKGGVHKRNWEPNILLFSGGTRARPHLLEFSTAIAGRNGMISNFDLIEDKNAKVLFPKQKQSILNNETANDGIFYRQKTCRDIYDGIETIAGTYGFSGVEPNTILMGWARNTKDPIRFSTMINILHQLDYNILFLDYDKKRGFGEKQQIDIWWRDLSQISYFTVQLVKLIHASPDWAGAQIRFLYYDVQNNDASVLEREMRKRVATLRKNVEIKVVGKAGKKEAFYEVVKANSNEADLIIIDLPDLGKKKAKNFVEKTNELLDVLGTTLIVKASSDFYEETSFNTELEKEYAGQISGTQFEPTTTSGIVLGSSKFEAIDKPIHQLDAQLAELNQKLGEKIYAKYADVITTCLLLLKKEAIDEADFYDKVITLVDDVKNNRLSSISQEMERVLNEMFAEAEAHIEKMPSKIVRLYSEQDLSPRFGDTQDIARFKKMIKRIPGKKQSTIHLKKNVQQLFRNDFLVSFEQTFFNFGKSTLLFHLIIKKWIDTKEKKSVELLLQKIGEAIQQEEKQFVHDLNELGRKFCNTVLKKVDKLNNQRLEVLANNKENTRKAKEAKSNLYHYPGQWEQNTILLHNQLLLNFKLHKLKNKILPEIAGIKRELPQKMLRQCIRLVKDITKQIAQLTPKKTERFEQQLIELGALFNIEDSFKELRKKIDNYIKQTCHETKVIPPSQLNLFVSQPMEVTPEEIDVKKVTESLIDNEIIIGLKTSLQIDFNSIKSELLKLENALRLLKYSQSSSQSDKLALLEEVREKVNTQFVESKEQLKSIGKKIEQQLDTTIRLFEKLLTDEIIIDRAFQTHGIIRKEYARKGVHRYLDYISQVWERTNNQLDKLVIKTRDLWTISDHQYRTKKLQNPHSRLANFVDNITLSPDNSKGIPFFYKQLFTGKHNAPSTPLPNRTTELNAARKAIKRFTRGNNGAILFIGEPLSGMTYLIDNVNNSLIDKKVIYLKPPSRYRRKADTVIHEALVFSTGLHLDTEEILHKLPNGSVIVFEDLELWWTRRPGGSDYIFYIAELISKFGHRILFMLSCNVYFYQHIRQYTDLDALLLDTIMINPLPIQEIKSIILKRHHSGGMKYMWNGKQERALSLREQNKLFKKLTAAADGNIGAALYNWLGNIKAVEENTLILGKIEQHEIPPVLSPEWEIMLIQILLHKQMTYRRLCSIFPQPEEKTATILQSLLRVGLLVETSSKLIKVNPYALPYLIKYLRRNELV